MKKLRNLLLSGLAALTLSGCTQSQSVEGTVIWGGRAENEVNSQESYKIKDFNNEITCVTVKQSNFHPFKIGDNVKLELSRYYDGKLAGEYVDGKFNQMICFPIEEYKIIKVEKEE